jgi:hypothetical protein
MTINTFEEIKEINDRPEISLSNVGKKSILFNIQLEETIDPNRVKILLNSSLTNDFKPTRINTEIPPAFYPFDNEKEQLKGILNKIRNGKMIVDYEVSPYKAGRVYCKKSLGLIGLRRSLRHALAYDKYVDIDIENAHPSMLYQLCGEECKMELLGDYIQNRQKYFDDLIREYDVKDTLDDKGLIVKSVRDKCKMFMTALTYGAGKDRLNEIINKEDEILPKWVIEYKKEIKRASSYIINCNNWLKEIPEKKNGESRTDNSLLSIYLQEHERRILEVVYKLLVKKGIFTEKGRNNGSLCFDGIMILITAFYPDLLNEISEEVYNITNFRLNFTVKDMTKDNSFIYYQSNPSIYSVDTDIKEDNDETDILNHEWYVKTRKLFEYGKEDIDENDKPIRFKCDSFFVEIDEKGKLEYKNEKDFRVKHRDFCKKLKIGKKKHTFIEEWFDDPDKVKYNKMTFDIDYKNPKPYVYNLFDGFEIEKNIEEINDDEIDELVKPILELLYFLCGENIANRDYILKVLSGILQMKKIDDKPCVMNIFRDIAGVLDTRFGGTGKDTFLHYFINNFIGKKYAYECSSTEDLTEKFNGVLANKIIINIPELSYIFNQKNKWDKVKNYITSPIINIEVKNVNKCEMDNYMTLFASTNEDINFGIDRRLWVVDTSKIKKYDEEYWNNLYNVVLPDKRIQKAFYLYLIKKIETFKGASKYQMNKPETIAMTEQKENKKSILNIFFENMTQTRVFKNKDKNDDEMTVSTGDILTFYKEWCVKNNYKCEITPNGLGQQLSRLCSELISMKYPLFISKSKSHKIRGYEINHKLLCEWNEKMNGCIIEDEDEEEKKEEEDVSLEERDKIISEIRELIELNNIKPSATLTKMIRQMKRDNNIEDLDL